MRLNSITLLATMLLASAAARAFAAASLTPLGDLPGGSFASDAYGISGDGSVVVGSSVSTSGNEAFRWTSSGGMVGLGTLPGGPQSWAHDVNYDGSVVVGESGCGCIGDGAVGQAFRWTSGGMVGLGILPGGTTSSARGVSADGSVVVGSSFTNFASQAFRWTSGDGMAGLGDLPGGLSESSTSDVSADGSVIVGSSYSASALEAFRWTSSGGMVGLSILPGGEYSGANAVSGDGSVVVGFGGSLASGDQAFRWTSDGGMVGLGGDYSLATDVSGDGSVVVGSTNQAWRWTASSGMEPLWDLLLANGVDPAADGWTWLSSARGVSDDGRTIVGTGRRNGNTEAFVVVIHSTVPEPAVGALALLGASSILLLRRRSRGDQINFRFRKNRPLRFRRKKTSAATPTPRRTSWAPRSTAVCNLAQTMALDRTERSCSSKKNGVRYVLQSQ